MTRQAIDSLAAQDPPVKGKEPLKKWRKANPPRVELPGKLWEHCRECWIVSGKITFAKGKASRWGTIAEGRKCCSYHYWMRYGDHTAKGKKAKAKAEGKAKAKGKGKGRAAEASEEDSEESDGDEEEQDKSQDQAFDDMEAGEESGSPDALEGGPKLEPLDPNESFTFLNPAQAALIVSRDYYLKEDGADRLHVGQAQRRSRAKMGEDNAQTRMHRSVQVSSAS